MSHPGKLKGKRRPDEIDKAYQECEEIAMEFETWYREEFDRKTIEGCVSCTVFLEGAKHASKSIAEKIKHRRQRRDG